MKTLWMYVSNDKYELPLAVADTCDELCRMVGSTKNSMQSWMSHYKRGDKYFKRCPYIKVEYEEDVVVNGIPLEEGEHLEIKGGKYTIRSEE